MSDLAALPFVRALLERGAHVYTVGGTVRDELLGHGGKDVDLLVTGVPQSDLIRFLRRYGRVQLTGRAFGVIKFLPRRWEGPPIDIALPRTEVSTGVGHRDFAVSFDHTLPIEVDLGRRDFTLNAMARDLADGRLIDPFGGQADLDNRILRQVSEVAFPEDPLRMLRGVQLAARFDLQVDPATHQAMQRHAALITTVASERIAEELRKLFLARAPSRGFELMHDVGLLPHLLPELARLVGLPCPRAALPRDLADVTPLPEAFRRTLRRLDALRQHEAIVSGDCLDVLLAALLQDVGLPEAMSTPATCSPQRVADLSAPLARTRLDALKMTTAGARLDPIERLIRHHAFDPDDLADPAGLRRFAHRVGPEAAFQLFDLRLADRLGTWPSRPLDDLLALRQRLQAELDRGVPLRLQDLAINGHDLQRLGLPPGPRLGQILHALLQQVLDDPGRNTREYLLSVVQRDWLPDGPTSARAPDA